MKHQNSEHQNQVKRLICEYEVLSQKGTVSFYEETVYLEMISLLEQEGKWQKASNIADTAISQHPFCADLYLRKAELLLNRNMIDECLVTIDRAEIFAPLNVQLLLLKADLLATKGEHNEALSVIETLKHNAALDELSEVFLAEAHLREDLRQYPEMFRSLKRCLMSNPDCTEGYEKILLLVERRGFYKDSAQFHNKMIDQNAYNSTAWRNLGFALRGMNRTEEAIEAFEYAFAIDEKCKIAYMEAAEMLLEKKDFARALYVYENAIFNTHEDSEIMQQLGYCYQMLKDFKTAKIFYQRAIEFDAKNSEAYFHTGESLAAQGLWSNAIQYFQRAIELEYRREDFHAGLANAYFQTNDLSNALFSYRKATFIAPDDVAYWMRYTYFLLNIGQEKMALRALDKAEMYCGGPEIEYCRVACLYQMGKKSEALYLLGDALKCDFDKHKSIFQWRPELAKNRDMQNVIMAFLP